MKLENYYPNKRVRLMFQDKAGFGRINKPKYCWCNEIIRPTVPCHHIRDCRYVYAAVEPKTGEIFFLVMPNCNTDCMNVFINRLSSEYEEDMIILVCDKALWHKSKGLDIPDNVYYIYHHIHQK